MTHTFIQGVCSVCGEHMDYLMDNRYGETLGPKLETPDGQGVLPLTVNVFEYAGRLY